jgi:hypothetical protein
METSANKFHLVLLIKEKNKNIYYILQKLFFLRILYPNMCLFF